MNKQAALKYGKTRTVRFGVTTDGAQHFAARLKDGEYARYEGLTYQVVDAAIIGQTHVDFTLRPITNY